MEARKEMALKQMELKGRAMQLSWFYKYFKKIYIDSGLLPQEIPRKAFVLHNELKKWEEEMAVQREKRMALKKEEMSKIPGRKWKPTVVSKWDLERGFMYPVEPELTEVLYHGVSHNDEGRRKYLHFRSVGAPCDRYYDPLCSSMDYGWRIEERALPANKQFATAEVIKSEFYRRYGYKGETLRNRLPISVGIVKPEFL